MAVMADTQLPPDITYGQVVGRFVYAVADTASDTDPNPDEQPATGSVSFAPYEPEIISSTGAPPSTAVIPTKITAALVDGYVTDAEGHKSIYLVAGLTYKVVISLIGSASIIFDIAVATGDVIDLPTRIPIKPGPTVKFVVNEQVYQDTLAAEQRAQQYAAVSVAGATVDGNGHLIFTKADASTFDAGNVKGAKGDTGDFAGTSSNAAASGTIDLSAAKTGPVMYRLLLTGNVTLTLPTPTATGSSWTVTVRLQQDATGSRTLTWPTNVKWPYGVKPTVSTAGNAIDLVHFLWAGNEWYGLVGGQAFA